MRVLQINTVCKNGSTGKIAYDIHESLLENGHESAICYGRGAVLDDDKTYKFSNELGVKIHALITRILGITGMGSNWSTNRLLKHIKKFEPDVVHLHNIHGYYVNIYRLLTYLKKNNIKTIITLHDEWIFTGNCGYAYECEKWKVKCKNCRHIREYPKSIFFDLTTVQYELKKKIFDKCNNMIIVTPSIWLKKRVDQSILKGIKTQVIYNGIDTKKIFYPKEIQLIKEKHNINNEKIILAVTPDFSNERKGGKYVLELAKMLEKNKNIKFIIVGVNEEVRDIPSNIIIVPKTEDQRQLAEYYSIASLFLLTSKFETFSMVCAEALSCGTPVIGFEAGAPSEIFERPYGNFIEYGNIEQLKNEILSKLNLKEQIGKDKIREYAISRYDKSEMYSKYISIYNLGDI